MEKKSKIAVLGATGMLGGAISRQLEKKGYTNIQRVSRSSGVDLTDKIQTEKYFKDENPEYVFMVAGRVGGILANNTYQADFLYENALMILNVLNSMKSYSGNSKLLYTGSTCIYPKENPQPINENRFMQGPLEETNKGYAVAKGMGIIAAQLYRNQYGLKTIEAMPTNLYGMGDNYDLNNSHFIAAMIKKFINNKEKGEKLVFWGSGKPRREALFADDCADACIYLMENYDGEQFINIGTGYDHSIKEYIEITKNVFDYKGEIEWDKSKPDGMYEKRTDISLLKSIMPDYSPRSFEDGLKEVLEKEFNYKF
ncbi:MAG TPA: GDP-L-fucose synthase [Ignavibacteria bacterium]|nr:GDP-L-fucose synthase [Ignavibacteria bacterium]